jgi:hypothetical protein
MLFSLGHWVKINGSLSKFYPFIQMVVGDFIFFGLFVYVNSLKLVLTIFKFSYQL